MERHKINITHEEETIHTITSELTQGEREKVILRKETGLCITVVPNLFSGTGLSKEEWQKAYVTDKTSDQPPYQSYVMAVVKRPQQKNALNCHIGGHVLNRHNTIKNDIANLTEKALIPYLVREDALTKIILEGDTITTTTKKNIYVYNFMIRNIMGRVKDTLFNVMVINKISKSHNKDHTPHAFLATSKGK